jgi:hypothetical protein
MFGGNTGPNFPGYAPEKQIAGWILKHQSSRLLVRYGFSPTTIESGPTRCST